MTWRDFGKWWLPVLLWMAVIFCASTDLGSIHHTSRIIGPTLRFFWPNISDDTIRHVQTFVRKTGHVSEYAILALLAFRGRNRGFFISKWSVRSASFAVIFSMLYACSDEFHQSFVPTREATVMDVLIDTFGACAGVFAIWMIGKIRAKW